MQPLQDPREPAAVSHPPPRDTPLWKLEASLKCRSCRKGRYVPPVHMIKLTATRGITPYQRCIRIRRGEGFVSSRASDVLLTAPERLGTMGHAFRDHRRDILDIETFATGSGIREIERLRKVYGRGRWRKRKGNASVRLSMVRSTTLSYTGMRPPGSAQGIQDKAAPLKP